MQLQEGGLFYLLTVEQFKQLLAVVIQRVHFSAHN